MLPFLEFPFPWCGYEGKSRPRAGARFGHLKSLVGLAGFRAFDRLRRKSRFRYFGNARDLPQALLSLPR